MGYRYFFGLLISAYVGYHFRLTLLETTSVLLFFTYLLYFIDLIGKKIIILEIASFTAILTWLIAPIPFYHYFNNSNELAVKWVLTMKVESDEYFSFALPATLAMIIGFSIKLKNNNVLINSKELFNRINLFLSKKSIIGFIIVLIGLISSFLVNYVPNAIQFVLFLFSNLTLVGLLYLYFSNIKFKSLILPIGFSILLLNSIKSGMFGVLVYMLILVGLLLISNRRIHIILKSGILIAGIYFVLLLQLVKSEYREVAWSKGSNPNLFGQLIFERISNPISDYDEVVVFSLLARLNQGWHIAKTMYHVPNDKPFANGETIANAVASTLIPRIIWPNKPTAGGAYNLERFWGYKIKGYSMNLGPIGEAYGNFGKFGAIVFMFLYGLFLNSILNIVLGMSRKNPTWIIWLPFLFLYAIGTETDVVSTLNYLVKSFFFLFILRMFFLPIFGTRL